MLILIALSFAVLCQLSLVSGQECTDATQYVYHRELLKNQAFEIILSSLDADDSNSTLYNILLGILDLSDTPERENSFNQALADIMRELSAFCTNEVVTVEASNLTNFLNDSQNLQTDSFETDFAAIRSAYGQLLCLQITNPTAHTTNFLGSLSNTSLKIIFGLQQKPFTLAFAVDDTGSMSEEIEAVKSIIRIFVQSTESAVTHYILTTFNDPDVGFPKLYNAFDQTSLDELLSDVESLAAHGGGDCPELGMTGILNALELSYKQGNIIVLTDAASKDTNLTQNVIKGAFDLNVCINFIFSGVAGCGNGYPNYTEVASATNGFQIFDLLGFNVLAMQTQQTGVNLCSSGSNANDFKQVNATNEGAVIGCTTVTISSLSESLVFSFNPAFYSNSSDITVTDPDGQIQFQESIQSFTIYHVETLLSGEWTVCYKGSQSEIRYTQGLRFSISVEFLVCDDNGQGPFTSATPSSVSPFTTVLVFTSRIDDLSTNMNQSLHVVEENGENLYDVPLTFSDGFLEGNYPQPNVEYSLTFEGYDNEGAALIVEVERVFAAGPVWTCEDPCENGGTCVNNNTCRCASGFTGVTCSEAVSVAKPALCSVTCIIIVSVASGITILLVAVILCIIITFCKHQRSITRREEKRQRDVNFDFMVMNPATAKDVHY